jgi:hypothetical protein
MAKGWTLVGTNALGYGDTRTRDERKRDEMRQVRSFNRAMRTTKVRSYDKMVEDADKTFDAKQSADAALLQAFAEKKLKSKALIKQAQGLKKKQAAKKAAKAQAKKENKAVVTA